MKPYYLASERAAAPTSSVSYIAPVLTRMWFRWFLRMANGTQLPLTAQPAHNPLQITFRRWTPHEDQILRLVLAGCCQRYRKSAVRHGHRGRCTAGQLHL